MADLPILSPIDARKVPQTTKDSVTNIVSFDALASYFFRDDLIYRADNVFIVDNDLNLEPIDVMKDATDDHIPNDIAYSGVAVTVTNPAGGGVQISTTAGKMLSSDAKVIHNHAGVSLFNVAPVRAGGISWLAFTFGGDSFASNFASAANNRTPMLVGVQNFSATESYPNKYYLGSSFVNKPLYSASMCFRNTGWKYSGLSVAIDGTTSRLQISSGTLSNWYNKSIRFPQTDRATFYYINNLPGNPDPTSSPQLSVNMSLVKTTVPGGSIPANTTVFHFLYLDPYTFKIYVFLADTENSITPELTNEAEIVWRAINAYAKHSSMVYNNAIYKTIGMFNENFVLLGALMVSASFTNVSQIKIIPLHKYIAGNGNALHPSIPDPDDYPNGGKLKARYGAYRIAYDYDGLLISRATALKDNYLFMYDNNAELDIVEAEYETTPAPWITLRGMGGFAAFVSELVPDLFIQYFYLYADRFTYQDTGRSGISSTSIRIYARSLATTYPTYAVVDYQGIKNTDFYIMIFRNNISMEKVSTTSSTRYHTILGCPSIPGINDNTVGTAMYYGYTDSLRAGRATRGSTDSVVLIEALIANTAAITDDYCMWLMNNALTVSAQAIIAQLVPLIGASIAAQVKTLYAIVQNAGMLCDQGNSLHAIIGYYVENNSAIDKIDYSLTGCTGIEYHPSGTTAMGQLKLNPKYPLVVQPCDVVTLTSGDMSPLQATFFWLAVKTNFLFFIGANTQRFSTSTYDGAISYPKLQVSEMPLP